MSETAGTLLEDLYYRQYFNSPPKINIENSFQSLETLTNDSSHQLRIVPNERNISVKDSVNRRESSLSDYNNLYEEENKLSDKSTTLFRNSNDYDTFLPCIESVMTDNDLSDLAHEFAEFGKSFSRDSISYEKEERDILFPLPKPSTKSFSERFKVEIDPKTKYTYNNLYNINTEIYGSPSTSPYRGATEIKKEEKKYVNDADRLDLRYIQNALLFDNQKDERELYNPNENILKALNDNNDKRTTKSFMDIDFDLNSFNKHLSVITKVDRDFDITEDEVEDTSAYAKNRVSFQSQNTHQNVNTYQSTRPTYLTSHQPAQPPQFNLYNKNMKRISNSPKPSPLSESNVDHYYKSKNNDMYDYKGYFAYDKSTKKAREVPVKEEYSINDSVSSDDIPLANITERKIKPLSTPTLSTLSISVPGDKKNSMNVMNMSANKSRRMAEKPLVNLNEEHTTMEYLKPEFSNSIANDTPERKVSTRMPKKKKKHYFSYCCSSKVLDNSFVEEGSRSINKDLYIQCQKEQIHSFEAKRINNSKERINSSYSSNLSYMQRKATPPIETKKEKSSVSFKPNYLSRRSSDDSDHLSGVSSSDSSSSSSSSSISESYTSEFESYSTEKSNSARDMKSYLSSDINDKSPPKSVIIPSNQTNTQYIQSKKNENKPAPVSILKTSPNYINRDAPDSPHSFSSNSTVSTASTVSTNAIAIPGRKKQQVKYCTSYEISEDGNWKLVERRYNDSKVLKVEIISRKMI